MDTAVRELAVPEFDRINVTIEGNGKILLDWKKYSQGISLVLSVFFLCIIVILGIVMFFGVSIIFDLLQRTELFERYDTEIFGLMIGIDIKDKQNKVTNVLKGLHDSGVLVLLCGENSIRLLPPLIITDLETDIFLDAFSKSLK